LERLVTETPGAIAVDEFDGLLAHLRHVHPVRFGALVDGLDAVVVRGMRPIANQGDALRFCHLVDERYDSEVPFAASRCPADGPLLIVAGAGSGKTRVLTHRIAHLIAEGVSPFQILAITFTNKAADEMKSRVAALVGPVAQRMWVSTFHSACVRMLRRDAERLGYRSSFTIYDQADSVRLTGYVLRDLNVDPKKFPPRTVHATISAPQTHLVDVETY